MKRFSKYLYEYDQEKRIRNIGFAKVEWQESGCTVDIYGKGVNLEPGEELELYLFYKMGEDFVGIRQGKIEHTEPAIRYRLTYTAQDMGSQEQYEDVNGIILQGNDHKRYASVWDDAVINPEHMKLPEQVNEKKSAIMEAAETLPQMPEVQEEKETGRPEQSEEEAAPVLTEQTCLETSYEKITRQDIARLPRCEWRLANNSFLLHGFYNYHHLVLIEEGEVCWLGVPGVFHEKEAAAAKSFGFPEFQRVTEEEVPREEKEKNVTEDFGYWCRRVRK